MLGGTADLRDWRHQDRLIVSTPAFYFYSALRPRSESFAFRMPRPKGDNGCLLFTLSFRKIRLESKWNTTYCVFPAQNIRKQSNIWKGSPVFPHGIVQTKNSVQIFFNDFFDTSSGYLVPRRLSLSMKMYAQRKAGRRQRLYPCHGPLRFITSHSRFALASTMRKTKHLRRRLSFRSIFG